MVAIILRTLISTLRSRHSLAMENPALRHQLGVLQRSGKKPRLQAADRALWALLCRFWKSWRGSLLIVQPETVIRWHREGFRLYWRWKSRSGKPGRPKVAPGGANLFFQLVNARYERGAMILTSNRGFKD